MKEFALLLPELRDEANICAEEWPHHARAVSDSYLAGGYPDHPSMADLVARFFCRVIADHHDNPKLYARDPFYNLPFNESLAQSVAMDISSRAVAGIRGSAYFITHKLRARTDFMIKSLVTDRLKGRVTEEQFENDLAKITGLTQNHLRTILYTQATAVLNAGRFMKAKTDERHLLQFPFFRYRNRHLPRSRHTHEQMDGFVAHATHWAWERVLPPNGFQCQCYVARVNRLEAIRLGWMEEDGRIISPVIYKNHEQRLMVEAGHNSRGVPFPDAGFWHNMGVGFGLL